MKLLKIIIIGLVAVAVSSFYMSCTKSKLIRVAAIDNDFSNKSFVQVYNAALGTSRNYIYVDASAVTGAALAFGGTFPSASAPGNFAITSGFREFLIKDTLSTSTQPQMSFGETLQASNNYTIFMYDTVNAVKKKTVVNSIIIPLDTSSRLRFANFAYSPNAIPAVDIFSVNLNANVFTNVSTTDVTNYISYQSNRNDTLYVRLTGTTTNLLNRTVTTSGTPPVTVTTFSPVQLILNPTRLRSYTVIFRGGYRTDLTTAATVRTLSLFASN